MNFLGIPTMSLGIPERPDDSYDVVMEDKDGIYRKVIHKTERYTAPSFREICPTAVCLPS